MSDPIHDPQIARQSNKSPPRTTAPENSCQSPTRHPDSTIATHPQTSPRNDPPTRHPPTPKPFDVPHPPLTNQSIEAYFSKQAYEQSIPTAGSDKRRNTYMRTQLVHRYMQTFGMVARQARSAVDKEMGMRYAPNPWDDVALPNISRAGGERARRQGASEPTEQGRDGQPEFWVKDGHVAAEGCHSDGGSRGRGSGREGGPLPYTEEQWDLFEQFLR